MASHRSGSHLWDWRRRGGHAVFQSGRKEELLSVIGGNGMSFIPSDTLSNKLLKKPRSSFEKISPLPLWDEYHARIYRDARTVETFPADSPKYPLDNFVSFAK